MHVCVCVCVCVRARARVCMCMSTINVRISNLVVLLSSRMGIESPCSKQPNYLWYISTNLNNRYTGAMLLCFRVLFVQCADMCILRVATCKLV